MPASRRALSTRSRRLITGKELYAMGDTGSCELVRGAIVHATPAGTRHSRVTVRFVRELDVFVTSRGLGRVLAGETGIYTGRDPDTVRGADVVYISNERWALAGGKEGYLEVPPDLIVEVLSRKDPWSQVRRKLVEYFACGVKLVWVADPIRRVIHAYTSPTDGRDFAADDDLTGGGVLRGFRAPVARFFE